MNFFSKIAFSLWVLGLFPFPLQGQEKIATLPTSSIMAPIQEAASVSHVVAGPASDSLLFLPTDFASSTVFIPPDPLSTTLRVITSLIFVLVLLFIISLVLQKQVGLNRSVFGKTLGVLPLDSKRFIYLVDVMGKILVLGVTDHSINLLTEITDKTTVDALRFKAETTTVPALEKLFPFLKKSKASEDLVPETDFTEKTELTHQQKQAVEKMLLRREPPKNKPEDRQL